MTKSTFVIFFAALIITMSFAAVVFAKSEKEEAQVVAKTDCKLEKHTDPEVIAKTMANTAEFINMMMIMTNPANA